MEEAQTRHPPAHRPPPAHRANYSPPCHKPELLSIRARYHPPALAFEYRPSPEHHRLLYVVRLARALRKGVDPVTAVDILLSRTDWPFSPLLLRRRQIERLYGMVMVAHEITAPPVARAARIPLPRSVLAEHEETPDHHHCRTAPATSAAGVAPSSTSAPASATAPMETTSRAHKKQRRQRGRELWGDDCDLGDLRTSRVYPAAPAATPFSTARFSPTRFSPETGIPEMAHQLMCVPMGEEEDGDEQGDEYMNEAVPSAAPLPVRTRSPGEEDVRQPSPAPPLTEPPAYKFKVSSSRRARAVQRFQRAGRYQQSGTFDEADMGLSDSTGAATRMRLSDSEDDDDAGSLKLTSDEEEEE